MIIADLKFVPQGTPELNLQAFDCGRDTVNEFFRKEAQDYQDELFGKTYYFCLPDNPSDIVAGFTVANASIFGRAAVTNSSREIPVQWLTSPFSSSGMARQKRHSLSASTQLASFSSSSGLASFYIAAAYRAFTAA